MNESQPKDAEIIISREELSLAEKLETLPVKPGVYQFKNSAGKVIYVGKAQNLRSRVRQYFQKSRVAEPRVDALVSNITDVQLIVTDTEVEALILEANLIKKLKPRYNVILKDDKSYPYIVITNEPFPRVFVTRRVIRDGSRYFGPYTDVKTMRFALKTVRDIFMIRSCNYDMTVESVRAGKHKVCLDYHIKRCEGPCEGLVSREQYGSMINQVAHVLKGKTNALVSALEQEMEGLSREMRYEDAARIRDRLKALRVYAEKQKVATGDDTDRDILAIAAKDDDACGVIFRVREGKVLGSRHYYLSNVEGKPESLLMETLIERFYLDEEDLPQELVLSAEPASETLVRQWLSARRSSEVRLTVPKGGETLKLVSMVRNNAQYHLDELSIQRLKRGDFVPHAIKALMADLRLPAAPRRVECFDISTIQGSDTVASMAVFVDGKARKSEYRKFKIRSVSGPDDFASMEEVIRRRFEKMVEENEQAPDLIVIDGGKGQLSSALSVLKDLRLDMIPIIGLAKRLEEVFVPGQAEPLSIARTSAGLRLLQQVRNEAHRFAVTYHRSLRTKRVLRTELDLIKGIGKKRAQELLEAFGSVQGVKFASEEQLADVVGPAVASAVKDYFDEGQTASEG
jgi:excinuclease ABC subunit C